MTWDTSVEETEYGYRATRQAAEGETRESSRQGSDGESRGCRLQGLLSGQSP
jgi:hypothetical protein